MDSILQREVARAWDERAARQGLGAVLTSRWSADERQVADRMQQAAVLAELPGLEGAAVLDVGCGIGRLTAPLASLARFVAGVDISYAMARRAAARCGPRALVVVAAADDLPFANERFDAVVAICVLQHVLDDDGYRRSAREIARVTRRDGRVLLLDGLQEPAHPPRGRTPIALRSWRRYAAPWRRAFVLTQRRRLVCFDDRYHLTLWQKRFPH